MRTELLDGYVRCEMDQSVKCKVASIIVYQCPVQYYAYIENTFMHRGQHIHCPRPACSRYIASSPRENETILN